VRRQGGLHGSRELEQEHESVPLQPPELDEEEAIKLDLEMCDLEELTRWVALAATLRELALAQQQPTIPLVTRPHQASVARGTHATHMLQRLQQRRRDLVAWDNA
jgi:hypothetical protein